MKRKYARPNVLLEKIFRVGSWVTGQREETDKGLKLLIMIRWQWSYQVSLSQVEIKKEPY